MTHSDVLFCFFFVVKFIILIAVIPRSLTKEAEVCDCSNAEDVGILQFSDEDCSNALSKEFKNEVSYAVYTDQPEEERIPAFMCSRWVSTRRITETFLKQVIEVPDRAAIDTTPEECEIMRQRRTCGNQFMELRDGKWSFLKHPEGNHHWYETTVNAVVNCVLEEVFLTREGPDAPLNTPLGQINSSMGHIEHNHVTIIWDVNYLMKMTQRKRLVEKGLGLLYSNQEGFLRLQDDLRRITFHLEKNSTCDAPNRECPEGDLYKVIGTKNLLIAVKKKKSRELGETSSQTLKPNTLIHITANSQYNADETIDHINEASQNLRTLQCDFRKLKHAQTISTAQYNGWLAASQLQMPLCSKLVAAGKTVLGVRCKPRNVTFSTVITKCGPQPRFENYTINSDGWELVQYSPCYWNMGFVNFNEQPHAYSNGTWTPVKATKILPHQPLATIYNHEEALYLNSKQLNNPGYG